MKHAGWILDLYQKDGSMMIWVKKPDGGCVRIVDEWLPRIYIGGAFSDLLDLACEPFMEGCSFTEKFEKAGSRTRSGVLEAKVRNEREADTLARRIQRYGNYSKFNLYNVDVPASQMYLYEKDLFPLAFVEVENGGREVHWTCKDSRETLDYKLPPLKTVRLQIETQKRHRIQQFNDPLDRIVIYHNEERIVVDSGGEVEKLLKLVEVFSTLNPDIVLTDGGDSFIFPYLAHRAARQGILDRLTLDPEGAPLKIQELKGHSYFSYGKVLYRETAVRLHGRLHIDAANAFFINDCRLDGLFEIARTCIIPIQRASRSTIGTSMTSLQLYHAVRMGILIPWNKNDPEEFKDGRELVVADRGGFIFEPEVGVHDDVAELDFTSLYPTIMLQQNLSGETVRCECCPNSASRVPELGYNICEKWMGIVPRSLDILLWKRQLYNRLRKEASDPPERLRYHQRQAALKWILVCS